MKGLYLLLKVYSIQMITHSVLMTIYHLYFDALTSFYKKSKKDLRKPLIHFWYYLNFSKSSFLSCSISMSDKKILFLNILYNLYCK